jgi:UDP-3-O-[3-hydroxymyristoyl] glucosamine N-acyltransferase
MENESQIWTLGKLAEVLGAEVVGPHDFVVSAPASSDSDNPTGLAFAEGEEYLEEARLSSVGAVIVPTGTENFPKPILRHPNPRMAFGHLLSLFDKPFVQGAGIHPTAVIHPSAVIDESASIGAYVVIEASSTVGSGAVVMPFTFVGENCSIGAKTVVMPHAVLLRDVTIGERCEIGPGAILGHAGFGYYWDGSKQQRVPQVGDVVIGDEVHIGALTAIDRATADSTTIDEGNKIDNLVQIAHNVRIGKHGVFASQVGIAGSSHIGARHTAGGQAGFADHVRVTDGVTIAGRAGVMGTISEPGVYGGAPCMPMRQYRRVTVINEDLPNLVKRLRALEKKVLELEGPA